MVNGKAEQNTAPYFVAKEIEKNVKKLYNREEYMSKDYL